MNKYLEKRLKSPLLLLIILLMIVILITMFLSNAESSRKETVYEEFLPVPHGVYGAAASPFPVSMNPQAASRVAAGAIPDVSAFLIKGLGYWEQKNYTAAENEFRTALVFDPDNAIALSYMGTCLYLHGEFRTAEYMFRRETVAFPNDSMAFLNLSVTLFRQNKVTEAITEAKRAYALDSKSVSINMHLLKLFAYTGDKWELLSYLSRAQKSGAVDPEELRKNPVFTSYLKDPDFEKILSVIKQAPEKKNPADLKVEAPK